MDGVVSFLTADIRMAMPIFIAAMGLVYSERAGIVNIGAEGTMLIGALAGFAGSYYTGSAWGGALIAVLFGALVGLFFAFMVITLRANQTVVGAALNIFGLGITTTLNRVIFGVNAAPPAVDAFRTIEIPFLSDIPVIGPLFFQHNALVYVSVVILVAINYIMFHTELGLKIRAVGENPKACDTLGINVFRVRYGTVIYSTMLCGLAGAYLSLAQLNMFSENMTTGRGFIALAAVVFGKFKPLGVLGAVLVFGAGEALQVKLAAMQSGIPNQFLQMVPYVLTILALIGVVGKSNGPASAGKPYEKD